MPNISELYFWLCPSNLFMVSAPKKTRHALAVDPFKWGPKNAPIQNGGIITMGLSDNQIR